MHWFELDERAIPGTLSTSRSSLNEGTLPPAQVQPTLPAFAIRATGSGRQMELFTWGLPGAAAMMSGVLDHSLAFLQRRNDARWRRWTSIENRCVIPWTASCTAEFGIRRSPRPLFFGGIFTEWLRDDRPHSPRERTTAKLFAICLTDDGFPVLLHDEALIDSWMSDHWIELSRLVRSTKEASAIFSALEQDQPRSLE